MVFFIEERVADSTKGVEPASETSEVLLRREALTPVSRFISILVAAIYEANQPRILPPLGVVMRRELNLDRLPANQVERERLRMAVLLFLRRYDFELPMFLDAVLTRGIATANGPLVPLNLAR